MSEKHFEINSGIVNAIEICHIDSGQRISFHQLETTTVAMLQQIYAFAAEIAKSIGKMSMDASVYQTVQSLFDDNLRLAKETELLMRKNEMLAGDLDSRIKHIRQLLEENESLRELAEEKGEEPTLRDQFAMHVQLPPDIVTRSAGTAPQDIAAFKYAVADEMLKQRAEKENGNG